MDTYLTNIAKNLNGDAAIKQTLLDEVETLKKNMIYEAQTKSEDLFVIKKNLGGKDEITIPSNYQTLIKDKSIGPLLALSMSLKDIQYKTGSDRLTTSTNTELQRLFWAGFLNRLRLGVPDTGFNFKVTAKEPQTLGRACADAELFLIAQCDKKNYFQYLPDSVKTSTGGKKLNSELYALFGMKNRILADRLLKLVIKKITSLYKDSTRLNKFVNEYKIPLSKAVQGLARTRVKDVKTNNGKTVKKRRPTKVGRPSQLIEVLTQHEQSYLATKEEAWDRLKKLTTDHTNGVCVTEIEKFRKAYKSAYERTWEITNSLAGWRATRRKLIDDFNPKKGRGWKPFKKADAENLFSWICANSAKEAKMYDFSIKHIDAMNFTILKNCFNEGNKAANYVRTSNLVHESSLTKLSKSSDLDLLEEVAEQLMWIPYGDLYDYLECDKLVDRIDQLKRPMLFNSNQNTNSDGKSKP